jgi:hypothetical protein
MTELSFPMNRITFKVREMDIEVVIDSRNKSDPLITLLFSSSDAKKIAETLAKAINELEHPGK